MKLVHTTENHASYDDWTCGSSCLYIYEIEDNEEHNEVWDVYDNPYKRDEILHDLGYYDDYHVQEGAPFCRYTLHITSDFVIVEERTELNI